MVFVLLLLTAISDCRVSETWHKSTFFYFDTVCEVNLFCSAANFEIAQENINQIFAKINTHFAPGSNDVTSPLVLELYQKAYEIYQKSQGNVDITVAPLSRLWGFLSDKHTVPESQAVESALELIGMGKIKIKDGKLIVPPEMELDWGGIAKGFGIDLAAKSLIALGISRGFINAGGDLYCWGLNPEQKAWQVGLKHPRKSGFLGVLSLSGLGAATTGDYQRFFINNGIRFHHVFDPKTGFPAYGKQSVTVIGPDTSLCDALSTALFVSKNPESVIRHYQDYGAVLVDKEGIITVIGKSFPFSSWE